jgi:hypothetical protein
VITSSGGSLDALGPRAVLIARKDAGAGYVYVRSGDGYAIPLGVWDVLRKTFHAEWSPITRELRLTVTHGVEAVNRLCAEGHRVLKVASESERANAPRGPLECAACGQPYRITHAPTESETCRDCGQPLELVPPPSLGPA